MTPTDDDAPYPSGGAGTTAQAARERARAVLSRRLGLDSTWSQEHLADPGARVTTDAGATVTDPPFDPQPHLPPGDREVDAAGNLLARVRRATEPPSSQEDSAMAAMSLVAVRDDMGAITDLVIESTGGSSRDLTGREVGAYVGRSLRAAYPEIEPLGLYDRYRAALESGRQTGSGPFRCRVVRDGIVYRLPVVVTAIPVADRLLVTWRVRDSFEQQAQRLEQAQRLAGLGWADWDLTTGETVWSQRMYAILGRHPSDRPLTWDDVLQQVVDEDRPLINAAVRALFEQHQPFDLEYRIHRTGGVAYLHATAEPVFDAFGELTAIRTVAVDQTARRRSERALAAARDELTRQRQLTVAQHRVARELRRVLLPMEGGTAVLPGLRYAVRYLAAESNARIGGDWYAADTLPDGRVLLAIGDAAGHGLAATALMAQLRSGLAGLSYTGARPGMLAAWLNELVQHAAPQATATTVIGHLDPGSLVLSWTNAGHPAPLLVRGGRAWLLEGEEQPLMGAVAAGRYPENSVQLATGDLLLLYTDGLVERRHTDISRGIAALREAAECCTGEDPDADIDTVLGKLTLPTPEDDTCILAVRVGAATR